MAKLIDKWTDDDTKYLKKLLAGAEEKGTYTLPTFDSVMEFLKNKNSRGFREAVIDDLIIRMDDGSFELELC